MEVKYSGARPQIIECVSFVNELLGDDQFWSQIKQIPKFDYTELAPLEIVDRISMCSTEVRIRTYRPKWILSRANAYVTRKYPNTLFLNRWKLDRPIGALINTIVHECVHIADYGDDDSKVTFGHGDNSPVGKEDSAPYKIGGIAQRYYEVQPDLDGEILGIELDEVLIED